MVLIYSGCLPSGALVRPDGPLLQPVADVWLDADHGVTLSDAGRVTGWAAHGKAGLQAVPVPGNATGTAFQPSPAALHFVAGENGGLVLAGAIPDGAFLTLGVILSPNLPEARTLLSVQPQGAEDYLFLSLEGTLLRLAQRGTDQQMDLGIDPNAQVPLLVLCALGGGEVRLSVNGQPCVSQKLTLPPGPADLFIGCRSARGGMRNKLGGFDLTDVMLWQGQDLLGTPNDRLSGATSLWSERCRLGH